MTGIRRNALTITEAAGLLGISRRSAYSAAERGDMPTVKIGTVKRVPVGWVRAKIEELGGVFPEELLDVEGPRRGGQRKTYDGFGPVPPSLSGAQHGHTDREAP